MTVDDALFVSELSIQCRHDFIIVDGCQFESESAFCCGKLQQPCQVTLILSMLVRAGFWCTAASKVFQKVVH